MNKKKIEKAVRDILEAIGEDPKRKDLQETPARVAEMYEEIFSGIKQDPAKQLEIKPPTDWKPPVETKEYTKAKEK